MQDLSLEVNHGPILIDNNLFLSPELAQIKLSQGVSFVHNTIAWKIWPTGVKDDRRTPYLTPHSTEIAGLHDCPCGNTSYFNNLFLRADMTPYNECLLPVHLEGNLYLSESRPSQYDLNAQTDSVSNPQIQIIKEKGNWFLSINVNSDWNKCKLIHISNLGKAQIPNQAFKRPGVPETFDKDYTGNKRKKRFISPGAINFSETGIQKIKVFTSTF